MAARRVRAPEEFLSCQASVEEEPLTPIERVNGEVDSEGNSLRKARPRKRGRTRPQCHVPPGSLQTLTTGSVFPLGPAIPDPCLVLLCSDVEILPDGTLQARTPHAPQPVRSLSLDAPTDTQL